MPTAHIEAKEEEIAKRVLMPGDPIRAKKIAEKYLTEVKIVNNVRNMTAYTGKYKGVPVTIFPSGMGVPSMGIYSYELFHFYNVDTIIRVGTAGAIDTNIKLNDVLIAGAASTDSSYGRQFISAFDFGASGNFNLIQTASAVAKSLNKPVRVGNVITSDAFYGNKVESALDEYRKMGLMAVEMETYGLYFNATLLQKKAMAIFTVSDILTLKQELTAEERENAVGSMVEIALETIIKN